LKITQRDVKDVVVLDLDGKLLGGPEEWEKLRKYFKTLVKDDRKKIIVNLEKVTKVSSTGFGILIGRRKEVREIGGDLVLTNIPEQVKHPFYIMELNRLFKTFESEEKALEFFA
jgi:anti-anti-sigma factor